MIRKIQLTTLQPFTDYNFVTKIKASNPSDLQSKLVLLTLTFPRLKVIWSSSPLQTASIFQSLKTQSPEPDPIQAVRIGLQDDEEADNGPNGGVWNQELQDMLRCVSGVTSKNVNRIIVAGNSITRVANWEQREAFEVLGKEAGRQVHRFFNQNVHDDNVV